jgi:hypothetical protein
VFRQIITSRKKIKTEYNAFLTYIYSISAILLKPYCTAKTTTKTNKEAII